jgi:hypothetical protein
MCLTNTIHNIYKLHDYQSKYYPTHVVVYSTIDTFENIVSPLTKLGFIKHGLCAIRGTDKSLFILRSLGETLGDSELHVYHLIDATGYLRDLILVCNQLAIAYHWNGSGTISIPLHCKKMVIEGLQDFGYELSDTSTLPELSDPNNTYGSDRNADTNCGRHLAISITDVEHRGNMQCMILIRLT